MDDLAALADLIEEDPEWFATEFDDASLIAALRLAHTMRWRPIDEAPIPPVREAPDGYIFHCLLQTTGGVVGEGCARYVSDGRVKGSRNIRILRWYFGDGSRNCGVCHDPRYFMPLPAKRED